MTESFRVVLWEESTIHGKDPTQKNDSFTNLASLLNKYILYLADAFSKATYSAIRLYIIIIIIILSVCVFPGNWTHDLLRC